MVAAIFKSDRILEMKAIGIKRLGYKSLVTIQDNYHIGSITKSMTSLLAGILVNKGFIEWETKVTDVYPELKKNIHPDYKKVTLRSLLLHRAGTPSFLYAHDWDDVPDFKGDIMQQRKGFAFWILSKAPSYQYSAFNYSNTGYDIAASMLEKVMNTSWEKLIEKYVFTPFDLKSFGFGNPAINDSTKVWGHWQQWAGKTPTVPVNPDKQGLNPIDGPSGDVNLSIQDLAKYGQIHLNALHETMKLSNYQFIKPLHFEDNTYSFGWFIEYFHGYKVSIHWGSNATFISGVLVCHEHDFGIAVMANSSDIDTKQACKILMEKALDFFVK